MKSWTTWVARSRSDRSCDHPSPPPTPIITHGGAVRHIRQMNRTGNIINYRYKTLSNPVGHVTLTWVCIALPSAISLVPDSIPNDTSSENSQRDLSNADLFGAGSFPTVEVSTMDNRPRVVWYTTSYTVYHSLWMHERAFLLVAACCCSWWCWLCGQKVSGVAVVRFLRGSAFRF